MVKKNEVRRLFETGAVKGYLPSDMAAMEIHINNMGNYTGAVFIDPIKKETGKPMPVLNLDALYESVKNSEDIIEAGVRSAGIVQDFLKNTYVPNIDFSRLPELMKDFDKISDRLYLSAVSPSYNNENTAMFEVQGMRFVPKLLLAQEGSDSMVAPLPRSAVKDMGLTEQEFFTKVSENTKNVLKPEIRNISDIFKDIQPDIASEAMDMSMLVVGAASLILDDTVLSQVAARYNNANYFIIPSSISEVIAMPVNEFTPETAESIAMLTQMVEEVNDTQVAKDEILSYDVYHYDAQKHKLDKATDYCINKQLDEAHQALPRADEELNEQICETFIFSSGNMSDSGLHRASDKRLRD